VLVSQLSEQFKARPEELPDRIGAVVERLRDAERELEKVRAGAVLASAGALADGAEDIDGVALVAAAAPDGVSSNDLRALASDVRGRLGARPGVVALFSAHRRQAVLRGPPPRRPGGKGLAAGKLVPSFAGRDRRAGRRQARPGPGRWHQPGRHCRRGAGAAGRAAGRHGRLG